MLTDLWGLLPAAASSPACAGLFALKVLPHISGGFAALSHHMLLSLPLLRAELMLHPVQTILSLPQKGVARAGK